MKYAELQDFVSHVTPIVEELGGYIPSFSTFHGVTLYINVQDDETYEQTKKIMKRLQEAFDGEIHYGEYWESEGYIPHSQAELIVDEQKALNIIRQDEEYYAEGVL